MKANGRGMADDIGIFSYFGKCDLVILEGSVDGNKYINVLQNTLQLWTSMIHGKIGTFQQDKAAIHQAIRVGKFIRLQTIEVVA